MFSFLVFTAIKSLTRLRVAPDVEVEGLDHHEHGISGYRGFREEERPLYEKLGGQAAVNATVDLFYKKVLADERLKSYFEGVDVEQLRKHQKSFLAIAFGGGSLGAIGQRLRDAHAHSVNQGIGDAEFDRVADHLEAALTELKVPQQLIGEALQTIDGLRDDVLNR